MKCVNCGAELGNITISQQCPFCGTVNTPFDLKPEVLEGEELELIFEKPVLSEKDFRALCRRLMAKQKNLPLDFFKEIKILDYTVHEGIVGVVKDVHRVCWMEHSGDQIHAREDSIPVLFAVPTPESRNTLPDMLLKRMSRPSTTEWFKTDYPMTARIPKSIASAFKRGYLNSLPSNRADGLTGLIKSELKKRVSKGYSLMDNYRITIKSSHLCEEPTLCKISVNVLKWQYKDMIGTFCYYPQFNGIIWDRLPEDETLIASYKKEDKKNNVVTIFCMLLMIADIVAVFIAWLKTPLRWYWALLIQLGIFALFSVLSLFVGMKDSSHQYQKERLSGPSNL